MDRRKFFKDTTLTGAGALLAQRIWSHPSQEEEISEPVNLMEEVRKYRKIDCHAHVYFTDDSPETQLEYAERLHIDRLVISRNLNPHTEGTPEEFRKNNDLVIECMKAYPDRLLGTMVLNPKYQKEALDEIDRCVDAGMVGAGELYNQIKINDPLYYPIIEKLIDYNMLIHMHTAIGHSRVKLHPREPKNISLPEEFVEIAARYPEAMFMFAHIGGGIDWEYACKTLQHSPNVYVDVSGSNNAGGMIDFAMKYIGEDRLLFGCDNSYYQGVGRMFSAKLTDTQRRKIFFDNYNNILRKSGNHVD